MTKPQLTNLQQTVANAIFIISNSNNINKFWVGIFTRQGHINQVYQTAVRELASDQGSQWSDSGPIKRIPIALMSWNPMRQSIFPFQSLTNAPLTKVEIRERLCNRSIFAKATFLSTYIWIEMKSLNHCNHLRFSNISYPGWQRDVMTKLERKFNFFFF